MAQWGVNDAASNSVSWAAASLNLGSGNAAQATNNTNLFGNTTADAFVSGETIGQFGVSAAEIANTTGESHAVTHTGWNLRTEGSGGRSGRVHYEVLVAGGISGDALDDTQLPET